MSKCAFPLSRVAAMCIGAGALFAATAASAATVSIYKVTDADGRVTYQNTPPGATAGRVERRAFDLEANAMNFTRPRAVGSGPGGGSNASNNNDVVTRLANEVIRRTGGGVGTAMSVTPGSGSVVFSNQPTVGVGVLGGGEMSGIVTPSGNVIGADNATVGVAGGIANNTIGTDINTGVNAGGGTGIGGGAGTGPAITNPSTDSAVFTGSTQVFTGTNPAFTGASPAFTGNSPTFTSNSATFSSNTGTLGPATPGVGAGTVGASGNFNNSVGNGTASGDAQIRNTAGAIVGSSVTAPQAGVAPSTPTGVAPGTNPFAGNDGVAPRGSAVR